MKEDYQKKLDEILERVSKKKKKQKLLLHACCGPCSSYVLEYLSKYFEITIYYYNPNIEPLEEFDKRVVELEKLVKTMPLQNKVEVVVEKEDPKVYHDAIKGHEDDKEGGKRCYICYDLRMDKAASYAKKNKFDYFTTTLSISPYKNAAWLNEIGEALEKKYKVKYLYADFKKKNGYKRSIELSKEYNLYRQDYCGCAYSKKEALERQKRKEIKDGVANIMSSRKSNDFKASYNDYNGFPFIKTIIILFLLIVGIKVGFQYKDQITNFLTPSIAKPASQKIIEEEKHEIANVSEYYFYGNHFNIKGTLETDGFDVNTIDLILVNDINNYVYPLKYEVNSTGVVYYFSKELNDGIILDDIKVSDYNMYIRVMTSKKEVYYDLYNDTDYDTTTYYSMSKYNTKLLVQTDNNLLKLNVSNNTDTVYDIVIDPGHGGDDRGACLKKGYCEAENTLEMSKMLKTNLEKYGYKVYLTRETDKTLNRYGEDGRIALSYKAKGKYLFSIHMNSSTRPYAGYEIYAPYNINYGFIKNINNDIKKVGVVKPSNNKGFRIVEGLYTRNFSEEDIEIVNSKCKDNPYTNISTETNYYFMIRETGGYMTGAYVDGREGNDGNSYRNSNVGLEAYIYEVGYVNKEDDYNKVMSSKDKYMEALAKSIHEQLK